MECSACCASSPIGTCQACALPLCGDFCQSLHRWKTFGRNVDKIRLEQQTYRNDLNWDHFFGILISFKDRVGGARCGEQPREMGWALVVSTAHWAARIQICWQIFKGWSPLGRIERHPTLGGRDWRQCGGCRSWRLSALRLVPWRPGRRG